MGMAGSTMGTSSSPMGKYAYPPWLPGVGPKGRPGPSAQMTGPSMGMQA